MITCWISLCSFPDLKNLCVTVHTPNGKLPTVPVAAVNLEGLISYPDHRTRHQELRLGHLPDAESPLVLQEGGMADAEPRCLD